MAKQQRKVYLGYEEEPVSEKNQTLLNYNVNKIGGFPDWPPLENLQFSSKCPLCGLYRMQVVQCYAPLENSIYHRTLYVFACVSPNCWSQSESWVCVRSQIEDDSGTQVNACTTVAMPTPDTNLTWCNGADEWDENDNGDTANGNFMSVDNAPSPNNVNRLSDEDDESNSFEIESVEQALGHLQVSNDAHNANMSPVQGAVGAIGAPVAAAELEGGDEPGLVTVDTPTAPSNDLETLLHQTAELPPDLRGRLISGSLQFAPKFLYVEEEVQRPPAPADDNVTELLSKYRRENEMEVVAGNDAGGGGGGGSGGAEEVYEEAAPLHGDAMFHAFVTRLRDNPGQILRYTRDERPLLGAPLPSNPHSPDSGRPTICHRCGSRLICELQLLPNFADALRILPTNVALSHLHFLSVLVFTCAQSCWKPGDAVVMETVIVQPEI